MKNLVSSNTQIIYNPPKTREKISSPLQKQQQQPLRISVIVFWYSLLDLQIIGLVRRHRAVRPWSWMQKQNLGSADPPLLENQLKKQTQGNRKTSNFSRDVFLKRSMLCKKSCIRCYIFYLAV